MCSKRQVDSNRLGVCRPRNVTTCAAVATGVQLQACSRSKKLDRHTNQTDILTRQTDGAQSDRLKDLMVSYSMFFCCSHAFDINRKSLPTEKHKHSYIRTWTNAHVQVWQDVFSTFLDAHALHVHVEVLSDLQLDLISTYTKGRTAYTVQYSIEIRMALMTGNFRKLPSSSTLMSSGWVQFTLMHGLPARADCKLENLFLYDVICTSTLSKASLNCPAMRLFQCMANDYLHPARLKTSSIMYLVYGTLE